MDFLMEPRPVLQVECRTLSFQLAKLRRRVFELRDLGRRVRRRSGYPACAANRFFGTNSSTAAGVSFAGCSSRSMSS